MVEWSGSEAISVKKNKNPAQRPDLSGQKTLEAF